MKITDAELIRTSERELIDTITSDLDWSAIEEVFRAKHHLGLQDDVEYQRGDMVIHEGKIAYKLDFDVKVTMTVLFDRDGNCLSLSTEESAAAPAEEEAEADRDPDMPEPPSLAQQEEGVEGEEPAAAMPLEAGPEEPAAEEETSEATSPAADPAEEEHPLP